MPPEYGQLLRAFRTARKLRLVDVARLSNLDVSYVGKIETEDRPVPSVEVCAAIHSALQLSPAEEVELKNAAAQSRRLKKAKLISMNSGQGAIIILPGKDILKLLKALKLKPTVLMPEEESKM